MGPQTGTRLTEARACAHPPVCSRRTHRTLRSAPRSAQRAHARPARCAPLTHAAQSITRMRRVTALMQGADMEAASSGAGGGVGTGDCVQNRAPRCAAGARRAHQGEHSKRVVHRPECTGRPGRGSRAGGSAARCGKPGLHARKRGSGRRAAGGVGRRKLAEANCQAMRSEVGTHSLAGCCTWVWGVRGSSWLRRTRHLAGKAGSGGRGRPSSVMCKWVGWGYWAS